MLPRYVVSIALAYTPVGSRVTCSPPPMDTDEDWLILMEETDLAVLQETLAENGWVQPPEAERYNEENTNQMGSDWYTYKKDIDGTLVNLIVCMDMSKYYRFRAMSSVAARLNLVNKADRKALFEAAFQSTECRLADDRHWMQLNSSIPLVQDRDRVTQATHRDSSFADAYRYSVPAPLLEGLNSAQRREYRRQPLQPGYRLPQLDVRPVGTPIMYNVHTPTPTPEEDYRPR